MKRILAVALLLLGLMTCLAEERTLTDLWVENGGSALPPESEWAENFTGRIDGAVVGEMAAFAVDAEELLAMFSEQSELPNALKERDGAHECHLTDSFTMKTDRYALELYRLSCSVGEEESYDLLLSLEENDGNREKRCVVLREDDTAQSEEDRTLVIVNCTQWVSLREAPDKDSKRLAELPLGTEVEEIESDATWTYCSFEGQKGYVLNQYLAFPNGEAREFAPEGSVRVKVTGVERALSLRAQPLKSADALAEIPLGIELYVVPCSKDYGQCVYQGLNGYVLLEYLTLIEN